MLLDYGPRSDLRPRREIALVDGLLQNGTDRLALWRAHSREVTTARQAAERRHARTEVRGGAESPEVASERAAAFQAEWYGSATRTGSGCVSMVSIRWNRQGAGEGPRGVTALPPSRDRGRS